MDIVTVSLSIDSVTEWFWNVLRLFDNHITSGNTLEEMAGKLCRSGMD